MLPLVTDDAPVKIAVIVLSAAGCSETVYRQRLQAVLTA